MGRKSKKVEFKKPVEEMIVAEGIPPADEIDFKTIQKLVINLPERDDRLEHFTDVMKDYKYRVVDAYRHDDGYIGCALSHIKCLDIAIEKQYDCIAIFEDDFEFKDDKLCLLNLNTDFDVFMLGGCLNSTETIDENFLRILSASRTEGYIVKRHFYQTLKKCFAESIALRLQEKQHNNKLDVYWSRYQKEHWFVCNDFGFIGQQFPSYSDILNQFIKRN